MKRIEGLDWEGSFITELACVKGCLVYLNKDVSMPWLFGATGYAFVLNMHESVSPGCPNGWNKAWSQRGLHHPARDFWRTSLAHRYKFRGKRKAGAGIR